MGLQKLTIVAYAEEKYSSKLDTYSLQINPESYTRNHTASYNPGRSTDTAGTTVKYDRIKPETISFSFIMDGTGVVSDLNLDKSIAQFKKLVYQYNGNIHSPNYLLLIWGGLSFKCRLTSLNIEYTLFDPDGMPLRAKLNPSFVQYLSPDDLVKLSARNSPDMTHIRLVGAGDTLPLMCHKIYGDSRHYLMVASHNGLASFRFLLPGTTVLFPPLPASAAVIR